MFNLTTYKELTSGSRYTTLLAGDEFIVEFTPTGFKIFTTESGKFLPDGANMIVSGNYDTTSNVTVTVPFIILVEYIQYLGSIGKNTFEMIDRMGIKREKIPVACIN